MTPAKKSSGKYVLTGSSGTMTFGLPDSDETLVLERGVPTEVPAAFSDAVQADPDVYPEGEVPEDAVVGPPQEPDPALDEPADEPPPEPVTPDQSESEKDEPTPDQA